MRVVRFFFTIFNFESNEAIDALVTLEEIKATFSGFQRSKSSGLDGWIIEFYEYFFDMVGKDLKEVVEDARIRGFVLGGLHSNFISLIPKISSLESFHEYRRISLCNLACKVISRIMANRLKYSMSEGIPNEQFDFLFDR